MLGGAATIVPLVPSSALAALADCPDKCTINVTGDTVLWIGRKRLDKDTTEKMWKVDCKPCESGKKVHHCMLPWSDHHALIVPQTHKDKDGVEQPLTKITFDVTTKSLAHTKYLRVACTLTYKDHDLKPPSDTKPEAHQQAPLGDREGPGCCFMCGNQEVCIPSGGSFVCNGFEIACP